RRRTPPRRPGRRAAAPAAAATGHSRERVPVTAVDRDHAGGDPDDHADQDSDPERARGPADRGADAGSEREEGEQDSARPGGIERPALSGLHAPASIPEPVRSL